MDDAVCDRPVNLASHHRGSFERVSLWHLTGRSRRSGELWSEWRSEI